MQRWNTNSPSQRHTDARVIDLHCHVLPNIDDGARSIEESLAMVGRALAAGTTTLACTPHIFPGLYPNTNATIAAAKAVLDEALAAAGLDIHLVLGADIQIVPDLADKLAGGELPTLAESRYFLFEPPHHVPAPAMLSLLERCVARGFVPVITHPERLTYAEARFEEFREAVARGGWLQITGAAMTGGFGERAQRLSKRLLAAGLVHIVASDGHDPKQRPPVLDGAYAIACEWVGEAEAQRLFVERPRAIIDNTAPERTPSPAPENLRERRGPLTRLLGRRHA